MLLPKPALAILTLTASLGLVGNYWRVEHDAGPTSLRRARLSQLAAQQSVYLIRRGAASVGYTTLSYTPLGDTLAVREESEIRLPAPGGMVQHATQRSLTMIGPDLAMLRFDFQVVAGEEDARQSTHIVGRRQPGKDSLDITITTGGAPMAVRVPAPRSAVLGSGVWPVLVLGGRLKPGTTTQLLDFDPTTLHVRPSTVVVGAPDTVAAASLARADEDTAGLSGKTVVYPVTQTVGGITYALRMTDVGLPITASLPLGLSIEPAAVGAIGTLHAAWARDAGHVRNSYGGAAAGDAETLIAKSAIQAGKVIAGARTTTQMIVRASGQPLPAAVDGGTQRHHGDTIIVTARPLPATGQSGYRLSAVGQRSAWASDTAMARYVAPEPFIESDRPLIEAMARQAIGVERDPARAAAALTAFVYRTLTKAYTASIPSAVEVARAKSGDCNEHTVLTVALARAAGIPARPVAGVVYVDGAFYFHAWVEVWLGGSWTAIDPTFGLSPADGARVRLAADLDQLPSVIAFLGGLKLDVVRTQ
jgi:hypothetical protein